MEFPKETLGSGLQRSQGHGQLGRAVLSTAVLLENREVLVRLGRQDRVCQQPEEPRSCSNVGGDSEKWRPRPTAAGIELGFQEAALFCVCEKNLKKRE